MSRSSPILFAFLFVFCNYGCIKTYSDQEFKILENKANANGFLLVCINNLICQTQYLINSNSKFKHHEVKLHKCQYFPALLECLRYKLKKYNLNVIQFLSSTV